MRIAVGAVLAAMPLNSRLKPHLQQLPEQNPRRSLIMQIRMDLLARIPTWAMPQ